MKFIKSSLVLAVITCAAVGAQAQTASKTDLNSSLTGAYIGGSIGSTKITDLGSKTGFGGYLGYNINPTFAVEVGVASMGTHSFSGVDIDTSNLNVSLVASAPITPELKVFGRVGYGQLKVAAGGLSATANEALFGAGIRYNINQNLAVRAEYTRLASDTGTFGVGLQYGF